MLRVGISGLGFMGKMHFQGYKKIEGVKVVAICDINAEKFKDTSGTAGNLKGADAELDFTGIDFYTDYDKMLTEANLDIVSITTPTYLHRDCTVKAFEAGLHVLCEKPMGLNEQECKDMIDAQKKSGKLLQIGHAIRFWPEYAKTKEIIDSGKYGKVLAASFQRFGTAPIWAWDNWFMTGKQSGGALLDLHIHDTDYVQYLFGMPKSIRAEAIKGPSKDYDHIVANYKYNNGTLITAEGGWMMMPSYGFNMSFTIVLEKATLVYDMANELPFKLHPAEGDTIIPELETDTGYVLEIAHFVKLINGEKVPEILTPQQSLDTIRLIMVEKESIEQGKEITIQ